MYIENQHKDHRMFTFITLYLFSCDPGKTQSAGNDTGKTETEPVPAVCPEDVEHSLMSSHGCILGKESGGLEHFLNIPFALPPVGELRWKRPVPTPVWEAPLEADIIGNYCIQQGDTGMVGDEDCLYLNIIRPDGTTTDSGLPILFFIHGGSFTNGSGLDDTYLSDPQLAQDSIVVTINYRLNGFGFLAHTALTDEDAAEFEQGGTSGNQGLFDALLALQWVKDNAQALGGDPEKLMMFGESAGGMSTCSLLVSPLAEGLFTSALIQSAGCLWLNQPLSLGNAFMESAEDKGDRIVQSLGCEGDSKEILSCMRELSEQEIYQASMEEDNFQPNVDRIMIPDDVGLMFFQGDFNKVPIIAGVNENEASMFIWYLDLTTQEELEETLDEWAPYWGITDTTTMHELYNTEVYGDSQLALEQFYSDLSFVCPTRFFLESVSRFTPAYGYYYTHEASWIDSYPALEGWGAYHSSELPFVFGTFLDTLTEQENILSSTMQSAWINHANLSPNVNGVGEWPLYNNSQGQGGTWMELNTTNLGVVTGVRQQQCDFISEQWYGQ
jgi:para-nitrobenzyl esterase